MDTAELTFKDYRMPTPPRSYPPEAYYTDGRLWWDRSTNDAPRGATGSQPRAASWLKFNVDPGELFSTEQVRKALGIKDEHFQRRLRELRDLDWEFDGMKDRPDLNAEYRMVKHGWWPGSGEPKPKTTGSIDARTRRLVLDRDGSRCVVCGVGAGEPYPEPPQSPARITIGHIIPAQQGGSNRPENLRCECARCNETVRAEAGSGVSAADLRAEVRTLTRLERATLLSWLLAGKRERSRVDTIYDKLRLAAPGEREIVVSWLQPVASN